VRLQLDLQCSSPPDLRAASPARVTQHVAIASPSEPLRLLDALDEAEVVVPRFSCRSARCGLCRAVVVAGAQVLVPAEEDERSVLAEQGASDDERLTCQLVLRPGAAGRLALRFVG
jgi:ferredoxin